ncbi:MAG TPA: NAD(P)/FAD-dependent oxidoreductase [Frankiaceae bacterium]|nr:NAD(P)/FAD-dependent oxidoreductase [Frankiaceae bacterium]
MTSPGTADVPDVIVVGAGHNGLVAACYLAKAGLRVEVVERDDVIGGAVSTVERFPGYRIDRGSSLHVMIRWTGITEELDLSRHGLRYLECDPWGFLPVAGAPGGGITFRVDLDRTCASIEAVCGGAEAQAYQDFVRDWTRRTEPMIDAFNGPPTPGRIGRAAWRAGKHLPVSGMEISRQFLSPGDGVLDETFRDERLKAALAWMGSQSGPPMSEPGTAGHLGWSAMLHRRPPARPVGGSGALTQALASRLRADGGRVRLGDAARSIEVERGRVSAVVTASGERLPTKAVVSACHVLTTMDLARSALPAALTERARRAVRVGNGIGVALRLGTTGLPQYPDAPGDVHSGLGLLASDRATLAAAYGDYLAGRPPAEPPVVVMGFSALDPSLAPAGRHAVTLWGQWYPYELAGVGPGGWERLREQTTDRLLAAVESAAPGFSSTVEHAYLQTPQDLSDELGLLNGNVMHVEMSLPSMFGWRPLPELSGYRTPLAGLYLAGASTHPGGGVSGASGRSAARVVLADLEHAARRRRLPGLGALPRTRLP